MPDFTRRRFLQESAAASLAMLPACSAVARSPARRPVRFAVAGLRVQGRRHLATLLRHPGVQVVAIADPDAALLMRAHRWVARFGDAPAVHQDARPMLDASDVDAVCIATPDHWHALLAHRACASGKHVFVETPVSHGIEESARMVEAARAHGRLVQCGLPARSHPAIREAAAFVCRGEPGRLRAIRAVCYLHRSPIGKVDGPAPAPPHIDFDVWAGPVSLARLGRRRLHGDWRFDWRTGNGELGEAGTELLDLARWFLGQSVQIEGAHLGRPAAWPDRVWTCGGRIGFDDDGETPNTLLAVLQFGNVPVLFDQRNLPARFGAGTRMDRYRGVGYGLVVEGDGWHMVVDPTRPSCVLFDAGGRLVRRFHGGGDPLIDFVDAVRQRRELTADIGIGAAASDLAHLVNLAHRTGKPASRVDVLRSTMDEPWLTNAVDDMDRHVGRNGFDLDREVPLLAAWQRVDPASGELVGNAAANALRRRTYRPSFGFEDADTVVTKPG